MAVDIWRPGSFTKNFSWGSGQGLRELHEIIRIGFDGELQKVSRQIFRNRVENSGRPDFIPINFFLLNQPDQGIDYLVVDELVFQALSFDHSERFDYLALYAFILSIVGTWRGAEPYQERPAMWAFHYVADRIGKSANWNTNVVSANDIQSFVSNDSRYQARTSRKLATNLNYLFQIGGFDKMFSSRVDQWWVDAIFLTLDRIIESRRSHGQPIDSEKLPLYISAAGFSEISGKRSIEKDLALGHIVKLFQACGERQRFDDESVKELTRTLFEDVSRWLANSREPVAAIHPTNLKIIKTIPRACALLAQHAGFSVLNLDKLAETSLPELVRENLANAISNLKGRGIKPSMTAAALLKLMRE